MQPDYSQYNPQAMMAMMGPFLIVGVAFWAFSIYIQWRIFSKAGYPGAIALVNIGLIIPLLNILVAIALLVIWIWFAFSEWPIEKRAKLAPPTA